MASAQAAAAAGSTAWHEQTPWVEIIGGVRAIVPLVLFLLVVLMVLLRSRVKDPMSIAYGISLCVIGMIVFNLGLTYGLAKLGSSRLLGPRCVYQHRRSGGLALLPQGGRLGDRHRLSWILGLGATLAEPALNALGQTVENLTNGTFPKSSLMNAVAWGVGAGIGVGVAKIIFSINRVPAGAALCAGDGPDLLLYRRVREHRLGQRRRDHGPGDGPAGARHGLGLGEAVNVIEGFDPLDGLDRATLAVLSTGLWIRFVSPCATGATQRKQADE